MIVCLHTYQGYLQVTSKPKRFLVDGASRHGHSDDAPVHCGRGARLHRAALALISWRCWTHHPSLRKGWAGAPSERRECSPACSQRFRTGSHGDGDGGDDDGGARDTRRYTRRWARRLRNHSNLAELGRNGQPRLQGGFASVVFFLHTSVLILLHSLISRPSLCTRAMLNTTRNASPP